MPQVTIEQINAYIDQAEHLYSAGKKNEAQRALETAYDLLQILLYGVKRYDARELASHPEIFLQILADAAVYDNLIFSPRLPPNSKLSPN